MADERVEEHAATADRLAELRAKADYAETGGTLVMYSTLKWVVALAERATELERRLLECSDSFNLVEARANELQGRVTVLEGMRSDNYIEVLDKAEARAEQLERELEHQRERANANWATAERIEVRKEKFETALAWIARRGHYYDCRGNVCDCATRRARAALDGAPGEATTSRGTGAPADEGVDSGSAPVSDSSAPAGEDADRQRGWLTGKLQVQRAHIDMLEAALRNLADTHHRTLTNSRLHDPEHIESFQDCPCMTCREAAAALDGGTATPRYTMDQGAIIPTDNPPHLFKGRHDRWCEICDLPDRHPVHAVGGTTTPERKV